KATNAAAPTAPAASMPDANQSAVSPCSRFLCQCADGSLHGAKGASRKEACDHICNATRAGAWNQRNLDDQQMCGVPEEKCPMVRCVCNNGPKSRVFFGRDEDGCGCCLKEGSLACQFTCSTEGGWTGEHACKGERLDDCPAFNCTCKDG